MPPEATPPKPATPAPLPLRPTLAARAAFASGAFCLIVALALGAEHFRHQRSTQPLNHPQLLKLKEELVKPPQNDQLKKDIQALDLRLRAAHDRYLTHVQRGQWLLFGGMAVFLASLQGFIWKKKLPRPAKTQKPAGWQAREAVQSTAAVAVLGMAVGGGAWWLVQSSSTLVTADLAKPPKPAMAAPVAPVAMPSTPFPTAEEVARNWGRFRGPGGAGVSVFTNAPLTWNATNGENILWQTKSPGPDFNSPVVWSNRLFLTVGTAKKREVFCYDADNGKLLWQKAVEHVPSGGAAVELPEITGGFACPTAATDGRRVYVMFANGDVAAFDFGGNLAWAKSLAPIKNQYGHAASLELWQDRLIIQLDHGESDAKLSRLVALNTADGKVAWEKKRETHGTWSSPIAVEAAGKGQIITLGLPHVIAYAGADGAELWRVEGMDGEVTPSPIFAGGLVLAPSPSSKLFAIKPDGSGDVTKTHVAWFLEEGVPDITCPVSDGQHVFMITTGGTLTCVDIKTGKKIWDKELELEFKASPCLAGNRLYLLSSKGTVFIVEAGPVFKELGRAEMGDELVATPAFADGRIYFRTKLSLFCVGAKAK